MKIKILITAGHWGTVGLLFIQTTLCPLMDGVYKKYLRAAQTEYERVSGPTREFWSQIAIQQDISFTYILIKWSTERIGYFVQLLAFINFLFD